MFLANLSNCFLLHCSLLKFSITAVLGEFWFALCALELALGVFTGFNIFVLPLWWESSSRLWRMVCNFIWIFFLVTDLYYVRLVVRIITDNVPDLHSRGRVFCQRLLFRYIYSWSLKLLFFLLEDIRCLSWFSIELIHIAAHEFAVLFQGVSAFLIRWLLVGNVRLEITLPKFLVPLRYLTISLLLLLWFLIHWWS